MKIKLKHILKGFAVGKFFVFNFSSCYLNIHGGIRRVFIHHLLLFNYSLLIHSLNVVNYINCHHYWRRGIFNFFLLSGSLVVAIFQLADSLFRTAKTENSILETRKLTLGSVTRMRNVVIESTQSIQVSAIKWISKNLFLGTDKRFPSRRLILTFTGNLNGIVLILWLCECTTRYQAILIAQTTDVGVT